MAKPSRKQALAATAGSPQVDKGDKKSASSTVVVSSRPGASTPNPAAAGNVGADSTVRPLKKKGKLQRRSSRTSKNTDFVGLAMVALGMVTMWVYISFSFPGSLPDLSGCAPRPPPPRHHLIPEPARRWRRIWDGSRMSDWGKFGKARKDRKAAASVRRVRAESVWAALDPRNISVEAWAGSTKVPLPPPPLPPALPHPDLAGARCQAKLQAARRPAVLRQTPADSWAAQSKWSPEFLEAHPNLQVRHRPFPSGGLHCHVDTACARHAQQLVRPVRGGDQPSRLAFVIDYAPA